MSDSAESASVPTPPLISVVVPVFGCAACLRELHTRLVAALSAITDDFEIILVNDGSPDFSWPEIVAISARDSRVKGINFTRNFGQHAAIAAGLDQSRGQWVVVIDCDLQEPPEEIPKLYRVALEGNDIVYGRRANRRHSARRRLGSAAFYFVLSHLTGLPQDRSVANFGIYSRAVIDAVRAVRGPSYFPMRVRLVASGFRATGVDVGHEARQRGRSSYSRGKLLRLAIDSIFFSSKAGKGLARSDATRAYEIRETTR